MTTLDVATRDLNVDSSGIFHVERVKGGTYDSAKLYAHGSGSIHVLGDLTIKGTLELIAESSATILIPAKVTCDTLKITCKSSSTINSNDLEVSGESIANVSYSSTCGLYLVLAGQLSGSVEKSSTLNTFIHWAVQSQPIDVDVDGSSIFTHRDWNGPKK